MVREVKVVMASVRERERIGVEHEGSFIANANVECWIELAECRL